MTYRDHLQFEELRIPDDDDYEEENETWVPFMRMRGQVMELSGHELMHAKQIDEKITGKVITRRFDGLTSEMRIRDLAEEDIWNIVAVTKTKRDMTFLVAR